MEYKIAGIQSDGIVFIDESYLATFHKGIGSGSTESEENNEQLLSEECPECRLLTVYKQGHCETCYNCGWSLCGL